MAWFPVTHLPWQAISSEVCYQHLQIVGIDFQTALNVLCHFTTMSCPADGLVVCDMPRRYFSSLLQPWSSPQHSTAMEEVPLHIIIINLNDFQKFFMTSTVQAIIFQHDIL